MKDKVLRKALLAMAMEIDMLDSRLWHELHGHDDVSTYVQNEIKQILSEDTD